MHASSDKCVHEKAELEVNDKLVTSAKDGSWAVGSTALFLLRTATESRGFGDYQSQMLPHCGHFYMPNEDNGRVAIMGCNSWVDWAMIHIGGSSLGRN